MVWSHGFVIDYLRSRREDLDTTPWDTRYNGRRAIGDFKAPSEPKPKRKRTKKKSRRPNLFGLGNPHRAESQRLFLLWDREVAKLEKIGAIAAEAISYREHYRSEMLFWSGES